MKFGIIVVLFKATTASDFLFCTVCSEQQFVPFFPVVLMFAALTFGYNGYMFPYDYNGYGHLLRTTYIIFCSWTLGFSGLCGSCNVNVTERS
jgi:hypothetical protein